MIENNLLSAMATNKYTKKVEAAKYIYSMEILKHEINVRLRKNDKNGHIVNDVHQSKMAAYMGKHSELFGYKNQHI